MVESHGSLRGKYEIIETIGKGGMGSVFKVRHKELDEIRVVKVMRSHLVHEEDSKQRFIREARIAAKARHQNIAQIFDFAIDEGVAFIIMEYIDGVTLQDLLAEHGAPSIPLALEIAQQSLRALAFVHGLGVVHRDISPDNLMLTSDSEGNPSVKLIDLGLAKFTEADSGLTKEGFFLGKLRYASPEHFQSSEGVETGTRSDVYSFGLVLYEMLTGRYPIKGRNLTEMMFGHVSEPPMPFSVSDPNDRVSVELRNVVLRAIEKRPGDRFADGRAFRDQVLKVQAEYPCGDKEREEALRLRQRPPLAEGLEKRGSDEDRLADAFRAEEESAGGETDEMVVGPEDDTMSDGGDEVLQTDWPDFVEGQGLEDLPSTTFPRSTRDPTDLRDVRAPTVVRGDLADVSESGVSRKSRPRIETDDVSSGEAQPVEPDKPISGQDDKKRIEPPAIPVTQRRGAERRAAPISRAREDATTRRRDTARKRRWLAATLIGLAIVAIATIIYVRSYPVPFFTDKTDESAGGTIAGTLVVNAIPWARIVEVSDSDGVVVDLGGVEFTPLAVGLSPGSYRFLLRNDEFGEKTSWATVTAGETTFELIHFGELDDEQFLRSLRLIE